MVPPRFPLGTPVKMFDLQRGWIVGNISHSQRPTTTTATAQMLYTCTFPVDQIVTTQASHHAIEEYVLLARIAVGMTVSFYSYTDDTYRDAVIVDMNDFEKENILVHFFDGMKEWLDLRRWKYHVKFTTTTLADQQTQQQQRQEEATAPQTTTQENNQASSVVAEQVHATGTTTTASSENHTHNVDTIHNDDNSQNTTSPPSTTETSTAATANPPLSLEKNSNPHSASNGLSSEQTNDSTEQTNDSALSTTTTTTITGTSSPPAGDTTHGGGPLLVEGNNNHASLAVPPPHPTTTTSPPPTANQNNNHPQVATTTPPPPPSTHPTQTASLSGGGSGSNTSHHHHGGVTQAQPKPSMVDATTNTAMTTPSSNMAMLGMAPSTVVSVEEGTILAVRWQKKQGVLYEATVLKVKEDRSQFYLQYHYDATAIWTDLTTMEFYVIGVSASPIHGRSNFHGRSKRLRRAS